MNCGGCWPERAGRAAALLLAALAVGAGHAAPAGLQPCRLPGVAHEALCGSVSRPLDPARAGGVQIDVHFALLPALARQKKPDPVFFLAGGPGQSAIDLAGPLSRMLARLGQRRDIVLVDQRGTGRSAPLHCGEDAPGRPLSEQLDPQRQVQQLRHCLQQLQALPHGDLRHFGTSVAMADLDAVRERLGAARINLLAASYGTRAALEYQRLYPQRVRRMVLDGVAPADMRLPEAAAADAQAAFDALWQACAQDADCNRRHPQLPARWQALLASLPQRVQVAHPHTAEPQTLVMTRAMLIGLVRTALYSPATAAALPPALQAAAQGRFDALVGLASTLSAGPGRAPLARGMHFSVVCSEDLQVATARAATAALTAPPTTHTHTHTTTNPATATATAADFGEGLLPLYREVCAFWPRGEPPAGFAQVAPAQVPVLLLSGGIDPATPPRHGERVALALGGLARHEVVPHAGHGLLALPCLRDAVFRFVDAQDDRDALRVAADCARDIPRPPLFVPPGSEAPP